jgi:hypothetical protein
VALLRFFASAPDLLEHRFPPSTRVAVYEGGMADDQGSKAQFMEICKKEGVTAIVLINQNFGPVVNFAFQTAVCKVRYVIPCVILASVSVGKLCGRPQV